MKPTKETEDEWLNVEVEASEQCAKCDEPATHMRILNDEQPNPPEIVLCEDHAEQGDETL